VQPELEPRRATRPEVATRLLDVERPPLDEDVGRLRQPGRVGKDVGEQEVDVGVRAGVRELGRDRVRPEPGRNASHSLDRPQLGELGVAVEAVPGLRLERRRARPEHPLDVAPERLRKPVLAGRARRAHGRENPAARRVQLLVRRARRAQRELLDPVAGEAGMRVAVDEAGDGGEPCPVELIDVVGESREPPHLPHLDDARALAEHVCALEHVERGEVGAAERRARARGRRQLSEIADEEPRGRLCSRLYARLRHASAPDADGRSSPRSRATSIASS
jgi:hypothetical protein